MGEGRYGGGEQTSSKLEKKTRKKKRSKNPPSKPKKSFRGSPEVGLEKPLFATRWVGGRSARIICSSKRVKSVPESLGVEVHGRKGTANIGGVKTLQWNEGKKVWVKKGQRARAVL